MRCSGIRLIFDTTHEGCDCFLWAGWSVLLLTHIGYLTTQGISMITGFMHHYSLCILLVAKFVWSLCTFLIVDHLCCLIAASLVDIPNMIGMFGHKQKNTILGQLSIILIIFPDTCSWWLRRHKFALFKSLVGWRLVRGFYHPTDWKLQSSKNGESLFEGFHQCGYPHSWMVFVRGNPNLKWNMTKGTPMI